jgi:mono/diheme cytochrome c family protein
MFPRRSIPFTAGERMIRTCCRAGTLLLARALPLIAALGVASPGVAAALQDGRTTLDGVFSAAQVARGEQLMFNICAECHVPDDFGSSFMTGWAGATVYRIVDEVRNTMPEYEPGSLPDKEYVDVVSYMFSLNGLPPGDTDLDADKETLQAITIALPEGDLSAARSTLAIALRPAGLPPLRADPGPGEGVLARPTGRPDR